MTVYRTTNPIPMIRYLLFVFAAILLGLPGSAQQWYLEVADEQYRCEGTEVVAWELDGIGYFGLGWIAEGDEGSSRLYAFDPVTKRYEPTAAPGGMNMPMAECTAFSVDGQSYVGLGWTPSDDPEQPRGTFPEHFRRNDPQYGWINMPAWPGGSRLNAFAFTIGNKAYVGGGSDVDPWVGIYSELPVRDLWAFNPANNQWTARSAPPVDLPKPRSFTIDGIGYVMNEGSTALWAYDPVSNTWSAKASYPGGARTGFAAVVHQGKAYVGSGYQGGYKTSFFAYDPVTDSWSPGPDLWDGEGRMDARSFTIDGVGYLVGGYGGAMPPGRKAYEIWRLGEESTPAPDTWTQRNFMPAKGRLRPIGFSIGDKGYFGGGQGNLTDFWMYDPATDQWTARAAMPGGNMVGFSIGDKGYMATQDATHNFYAYDPVSNTWEPKADRPGGSRTGMLGFAVEGKGYVCSGISGNTAYSDLWSYDPETDTWLQCADRPGLPTFNGMGFAIGNKGYAFGGSYTQSSGSHLLHEYDPAKDQWRSRSGDIGNRRRAQAFAVGGKAYVVAGEAGSGQYYRRFASYDPVTNAWTELDLVESGFRHDGAAVAIGDKGYIFGGRRNMYHLWQPEVLPGAVEGHWTAMNDLWEFNPSTVQLDARVFLDGPYEPDDGLMRDDLRTGEWLPTTDVYSARFPYPGANYSDRIVQIPPDTGEEAVVDRVVVELRDAADPSQVKTSRHVWLRRDGAVVDMDGTTPVRFTVEAGTYHVAIHHRNHLGVMTATPVAFMLEGTASIDFTDPATPTYGTEAQRIEGGVARCWAGDALPDAWIKYTGAANDRDPILQRVGGTLPTNTVMGYYDEDVNMDGVVKYTGPGNDRDRILQTIGGQEPTATKGEQMP